MANNSQVWQLFWAKAGEIGGETDMKLEDVVSSIG